MRKEIMAKLPTYEAKNVAEMVLDGFEYQGKTIREWMKIIVEQELCEDAISREAGVKAIRELSEYHTSDAFNKDRVIRTLRNLPSVTPQESKMCSVLDKIRAEIEPTRKMYFEMNDIDWVNGCDYVLSVIDKYKAESEEK